MGARPIVDWALIDWRKAERSVYRLQKRIFRASCRGDTQVVHNLQRKLMRSRSARLLAVRRVTQDNQGTKTAGVDGKTALRRSDESGYRNLANRRSDHSASRPSVTGRNRRLPSKPWNRNGKPSLNPTVMDSDQAGPAMMRKKPSYCSSATNPSMSWTRI